MLGVSPGISTASFFTNRLAAQYTMECFRVAFARNLTCVILKLTPLISIESSFQSFSRPVLNMSFK